MFFIYYVPTSSIHHTTSQTLKYILGGVKETVVGYSGGEEENPTYKKIKDYTEAIQSEF
jgi:peptide methionine sulfoxide reductase MsrA